MGVFTGKVSPVSLAEVQSLKRGAAMQSFLRDLMAHAEWANAVFFHAWGKSPARDHEEMRQRVGHIIGVQHGFLSVLRGEAPGGPPGGPANPAGPGGKVVGLTVLDPRTPGGACAPGGIPGGIPGGCGCVA